jgi:GDP-4-dehydro-6-deoxy-D-mannose reductase
VRALITGVGGFVGGHLARRLLTHSDYDITGTVLTARELTNPLAEQGVHLRMVDLTNAEAVTQLLGETQPQEIYHLAAQAFVPLSFQNPWATLSNNIQSQLHLLHGMVTLDLDARILVVGSGEEYGSIRPDEVPVSEIQPLRPASPYSVSKVTQDMLGLQYYLSHDVAAIRVRPFNQIGPGQSPDFVAPAFAQQIAAIEKGLQEPIMYVGNLQAQRDFTDVRDMVRAYILLIKQGEAGEVYNAGSGQSHSIQEMLDTFLMLTDAPIEVRFDPVRARPVDVPVIVCDASKLRAATGWKPTYSFEQSLADVLNDQRTRIGLSKASSQ